MISCPFLGLFAPHWAILYHTHIVMYMKRV